MRLNWVIGALCAVLISVGLATGAAAQGQGGGERISGEIASADADGIRLVDGTSLTLGPTPRITVLWTGTGEDLAMGQFAAITATRLPDGSLLASQIRIFPASARVPSGQFPIDDTHIMTNASIDDATIDVVEGSQLLVRFQDQTERVNLLPQTQIVVQADGSAADLIAGARVIATVNNGSATSVTVSL